MREEGKWAGNNQNESSQKRLEPNLEANDLYEILGLSRDATERDIQRSYRRLAVRTHPDRNLDDPEQAKAKFQKLNRAKNILSDPKLRSIYDKSGEMGLEAHERMGDYQFLHNKCYFTLVLIIGYLCCCFCCCLCCTAFRKDDYERDSEWRKATSSSRTSSRSPSLYEPANFGAPSKPTPIPLDAKASPKKFPTPPPTASSSPPPKAVKLFESATASVTSTPAMFAAGSHKENFYALALPPSTSLAVSMEVDSLEDVLLSE